MTGTPEAAGLAAPAGPDPGLLDLALAAEFPGARGYLNTSSLGLPPNAAVLELHRAVDEWAAGRAAPADYDQAIARSRAGFARLTGVPVDWVAVAGQVAGLVSLVAAGLPAGSEVVSYAGEFTSVIFPFLARPDLTVRLVPLADLAAAVDQRTALVAVSAVQSSDGALADLPAIIAAARAHGARAMVDGTQSVGWLRYDAAEIDIHVVGAYKWLLSPRGTAFASVRPELWDTLPALHANWYAGQDPWQSIYGGPLRLADNARRFDLSPAWLPWVGTAAALDLLERIGLDRIHRHDVALADAARQRLGLPPSQSAVVSLTLPPGAEQRLADRQVRYAVRDGRARFSFHLYNTAGDIDLLVDCLTGAGAAS
jgi:selenocysteine lyase/cysteine desulfurase